MRGQRFCDDSTQATLLNLVTTGVGGQKVHDDIFARLNRPLTSLKIMISKILNVQQF